MHEQPSLRWMNVALGIWLAVSAFVWPHSAAQAINEVAVGGAAAIIAALGLHSPRLRYVNSLLSVWLFSSAWLLPHVNVSAAVNDVVIAVVMFVVALVPSPRAATLRGR